MGVTLTDVLLFGKAQSDDVDNATLVIYRRNILRWSALGGYLDIIVKGVSPLSLPDAIANSLQYVKAYGGTELSGTPTTSTPATITCNNGTLKVKDSELPVGYRRLQNVKTRGDVRYVSNVYLTGGDTLRFSFQASPGNLLGSYNDPSANDNYSFYNTTGATGSYARYNGQTGGSATYTGTTYNVTMSPTGITGTRNPSSFTPREFTCSVPFCIFATSPTGSEHSNATIIGNIEVSGSQTLKFIPCERVSDGAIGYWETSNQEFLENQENGTPTTDGYDTSYMTEIYADGTVETITVHGKNLFDKDTMWVDGKAVRAGDVTADKPLGSEIVSNSWDCSDYVPVLPETTYTYTIPASQNVSGAGIVFFRDKTIEGAISGNTLNGELTRTFTTPEDCHFLRFSWRSSDNTNVQLELGSTATDYEPYYDGGTATAEMLLKIGDYADVQEILSGAVTRNIGIKIFDGTEDWVTMASTNQYIVYSLPMTNCGSISDWSARTGDCTHFDNYIGTVPPTYNDAPLYSYWQNKPGTYLRFKTDVNYPTVESFKQFLADQYNAGTPVIIVYPLATPTTESVAGQTLQVQAGDNTLEITQASIDGLELEAKYAAAVALTIQEVQDANLDPNVEVTIN